MTGQKVPDGRAGTSRAASGATRAAGRTTTLNSTLIAIITTVTIITTSTIIPSITIIITTTLTSSTTASSTSWAVTGPVTGLAATETLVVGAGGGALTTVVGSFGQLDDHTATEETHTVTVLDSIFSITGILILDESVS